ncbi:MAG: phosphoglucosamine mutase [Candidatus Anstonellaceae archaeon]
MFGTSGIRGVYGSEITPQLAYKVGNALKSISSKVVICKDTRPTSPILANQLAAGAMQAGCSVIDAGVGPTPLLAYATWKEKCAGAMITASHNPPEYNGIKLFLSGMEFSKKHEEEIKKAYNEAPKVVDWKEVGQLASADYSADYLSFILSKVDVQAIAKKRPKVLLDCGNAAAYLIAPKLFSELGCQVMCLNCEKPGNFTRNLEPNLSTLKEASERVVAWGCDFGIAFDGDGDRAIAICEDGKVLALDVQLALFCKYFISKSGKTQPKIVTTVEASLAVRQAAESLGAKIIITPVGSLNVAEAVLNEGAVFGGEPCGEYIFPDALPCADGLMTAVMIAEMFAKLGRFSEAARQIKTYPMERRKYKCSPEKKEEIMQKILERPAFEGKMSCVDGLRYDFEDGWVLIRPSGTEPAIRLTCEAKTQKRLHEVVQRAEKIILEEIHRS